MAIKEIGNGMLVHLGPSGLKPVENAIERVCFVALTTIPAFTMVNIPTDGDQTEVIDRAGLVVGRRMTGYAPGRVKHG